MVLGKLPVPGRPTIWFTVGQGPTALTVGTDGGCLDIFTLLYPFFSFSLSLADGPMKTEILSQRAVKPKTTNQPVPGRPTILITVGQGPITLAVGAVGVVWTLLLSPILSSLSPSLWETARYRLKYCLKGPLNPKQPTNQIIVGQGPAYCACSRCG